MPFGSGWTNSRPWLSTAGSSTRPRQEGVDLAEVLRHRQADERAVVRVRPGVERAAEAAALAALFGDHACAAVAAGVHEGAEAAGVVARGEHGRAEIVEREEGAGLRQVAGEADQLGMIAEERVPFAGGEFGVHVDTGRVPSQTTGVDVRSRVDAREHLLDLDDLFFLAHRKPPRRTL